MLRQAVAEHQERFWGLEFDPDTEVLVTAGATEAITASILALAGPGDEVVTFEPYFDIYPADISMAGATYRLVQLRPPAYTFDPDELAAAFAARTRMLLLNSPHNPTGKVFSGEELDIIARLCVEHDVIAVTDEVYEHLVFDQNAHVPLATRPGMADRTVTISSGGKTLSFTGWKIGWGLCPPGVGAGGSGGQAAAHLRERGPVPARGGGRPGPRRRLLRRPRGPTFRPGATCCAMGCQPRASSRSCLRAPTTSPPTSAPSAQATAWRFCRSLPERCGVVAVPVQVLCDDKALGAPFVRFAACKRPEVLTEAVERLAALASR